MLFHHLTEVVHLGKECHRVVCLSHHSVSMGHMMQICQITGVSARYLQSKATIFPSHAIYLALISVTLFQEGDLALCPREPSKAYQKVSNSKKPSSAATNLFICSPQSHAVSELITHILC